MGQMTGEVDLGLYRRSLDSTIALGEPQTADDFELVFDDYPDLTYMVQSAVLPEVAREPVEDYGPHGVQLSWYGKPRNMIEFNLTFKEVRKGTFFDALEDIVSNKKYVSFSLKLKGEGYEGKDRRYENCMLSSEAMDLSYEDNTVAKPSVTVVCNLPHWLAQAKASPLA